MRDEESGLLQIRSLRIAADLRVATDSIIESCCRFESCYRFDHLLTRVAADSIIFDESCCRFDRHQQGLLQTGFAAALNVVVLTHRYVR